MLILTWFIYIVAEARIQWYLIEKKRWKPIYLQLFVIRGMASIIHGICIGVGDDFTKALEVQSYIQFGVLLAFQCSTFWIVFDLVLNALRDRPWDYRGKTSGWLDRMPRGLWVVGKVLVLLMAIVSGWYYIVSY